MQHRSEDAAVDHLCLAGVHRRRDGQATHRAPPLGRNGSLELEHCLQRIGRMSEHGKGAAVGQAQHPSPVRSDRGDQKLVVLLDGVDHFCRGITPQTRSPLEIRGDDRDHESDVGGPPASGSERTLATREMAGEQGRFLHENGTFERRQGRRGRNTQLLGQQRPHPFIATQGGGL